MENGVRKFKHRQHLFTTEEVEFALMYLRKTFPSLDKYSELANDTEVILEIADHDDRSAGDPFQAWGTPTKESAVESYGLEQLEDYYHTNTPIVAATLKDELRPVGKDSRFFRPQCVASYIEGVRLFSHQNEYITRTFESPVFCRYVTPGSALTEVFRRLASHSKNIYAADGASWDANFPLACAEIIATFRAAKFPNRVRRYYRNMYNGYTNVGGHIIHLVGQPSGHHNTTVDNCLAHLIIMAVHAYRSGLSLDEFEKEVLYYCCGDDLIWSTLTDVFNPYDLDRTYASIGVYLEYEYFTPQPITKLSFCGTSYVVREFNGMHVPGNYLSHAKAHVSLHFHPRNLRPLDILAKICSISQLLFMKEDLFSAATKCYESTLALFVSQGVVSFNCPDVRGHLAAMEPHTLMRRYTMFE